MIRLENVSFETDNGLFTDVNFHLADGEAAVILGRRNAGKSDFINVCLGRLPVTAGSVSFMGRPVDPSHFAGGVDVRRIGYVSQHVTLLDNLTVAGNVGLPLAYHEGVPPRELRMRVMPVLERLGIAPLADRFPHQINTNEAKMAMLARAVMLDPELLVLDEPTAGDLDPAGFLEVMAAIRGLRAKGMTMLILTCSPSMAAIEGAHFYYLLERHLHPHGERLDTDDPAAREFFREIKSYTERQKQEISGFYKIMFNDDGDIGINTGK